MGGRKNKEWKGEWEWKKGRGKEIMKEGREEMERRKTLTPNSCF
jgi:hypothetical protein